MYEEIQPLQKIQLEILKELKRVSNENHIQYYLFFGTLIGAVRHKGFIPWDDDIDTVMNYRDYVKFKKIANSKLADGYFLQSPETDKEYHSSYYKLRKDDTTLIIDYVADKDIHHGINIDIYPLYNVPDNIVLRKVQLINTMLYMLMEVGEVPRNHGKIYSVGCGILLFFIKGKLREKIKNKCHKNMAKYENTKTKYKATLCCNSSDSKRLYLAESFEKTIEMPFEDDKFAVPVGYDEILTRRYGNYRKLPPKEEREVKLEHIVKIDTEKSYLSYKGKFYCKK